jgi:uncharacterized metal-binding protein (TIGR02443 family)
MFSAKKRFIAGAVCPRCSEMDKIVAFNEGGKDFRECVACGFQEEMRFNNVARELDTRVNRTDEEIQSETSVVKLVDFSDNPSN